MFKKKSLSVIDSSLNNVYEKLFESKTESLRQFLLEGPTHHPNIYLDFDLTQIHLKTRKLSQKIGLAIVSWYFPSEIRFLVHLSLREIWGADLPEVKEILLSSKEFALTWLICESKWTESDFFGNILDKRLANLWQFSNFRRLSRKKVKRYTGWCRGHQESNHRSSEFFDPEIFSTSSVEEAIVREQVFYLNLSLLREKILDDLYFLRMADSLNEMSLSP
jgi:hypothetical protein